MAVLDDGKAAAGQLKCQESRGMYVYGYIAIYTLSAARGSLGRGRNEGYDILSACRPVCRKSCPVSFAVNFRFYLLGKVP